MEMPSTVNNQNDYQTATIPGMNGDNSATGGFRSDDSRNAQILNGRQFIGQTPTSQRLPKVYDLPADPFKIIDIPGKMDHVRPIQEKLCLDRAKGQMIFSSENKIMNAPPNASLHDESPTSPKTTTLCPDVIDQIFIVDKDDGGGGGRKIRCEAEHITNPLPNEHSLRSKEEVTQEVSRASIAESLIELRKAVPDTIEANRSKSFSFSSNISMDDVRSNFSCNEKGLSKPTTTFETGHIVPLYITSNQKPHVDNDKAEIAETLIELMKIGTMSDASKPASAGTDEQQTAAKSELVWNRRMIELNEFKKVHGHTNVPQKYEKNPSLGAWIARQRLFMRQWEENPHNFSAVQCERMKKLTETGLLSGIGKGAFGRTTGVFLSSRNEKEWENQYQKLKEFRTKFGHCDVPVKSDMYRSLGRWVSAQRRKYRQYYSEDSSGVPSNDLKLRFQRLNDIGFKFSIGSGNAKRSTKSVDRILDQDSFHGKTS